MLRYKFLFFNVFFIVHKIKQCWKNGKYILSIYNDFELKGSSKSKCLKLKAKNRLVIRKFHYSVVCIFATIIVLTNNCFLYHILKYFY